MPAFLGPIMTSNFSVALASHGLTPQTQSGDSADFSKKDFSSTDLVAELRYQQDNLTEEVTRDDFAEHLALGEAQRFVAKIMIEIRDTQTNEVVWSGQIQRLHDVGPGEYMHTGKASIALLEAFTQVLQDFPQAATSTKM